MRPGTQDSASPRTLLEVDFVSLIGAIYLGDIRPYFVTQFLRTYLRILSVFIVCLFISYMAAPLQTKPSKYVVYFEACNHISA